MNNTEIIKKSLMKRHLAESRFKTYGILGIISATVFLIVILSTIFIMAYFVYPRGLTEIVSKINII